MKKEKPVVTTLKKSKTAKFGKNGKLFVLQHVQIFNTSILQRPEHPYLSNKMANSVCKAKGIANVQIQAESYSVFMLCNSFEINTFGLILAIGKQASNLCIQVGMCLYVCVCMYECVCTWVCVHVYIRVCVMPQHVNMISQEGNLKNCHTSTFFKNIFYHKYILIITLPSLFGYLMVSFSISGDIPSASSTNSDGSGNGASSVKVRGLLSFRSIVTKTQQAFPLISYKSQQPREYTLERRSHESVQLKRGY